jgi:hypothetical protein
MRKISFAIITFFVLVSFRPGKPYYCACCAEEGDYYTYSVKVDKEKLNLFAEMKMNKGTDIYMTEAEENWFKGMKGIEKGYNDWASTDTVEGNKYFSVNTGTLNLLMPLKVESFGADIHDTDRSSMIVLYKEYRFKGAVQSGTGFFSAGLTKPASYTLILQGRGNYCENATDYKNWRLQVKGAAADFVLMGTFSE